MAIEHTKKLKSFSRLDRIEAKLDAILALLLVQPLFIRAPHSKDADEEWGKAAKRQELVVEKLKPIYENRNDTTRKQDRVPRQSP